MTGRPRTIQMTGVRWRCIRCAAGGVSRDEYGATVAVIRHNQKVHTEDREETM